MYVCKIIIIVSIIIIMYEIKKFFVIDMIRWLIIILIINRNDNEIMINISLFNSIKLIGKIIILDLFLGVRLI